MATALQPFYYLQEHVRLDTCESSEPRRQRARAKLSKAIRSGRKAVGLPHHAADAPPWRLPRMGLTLDSPASPALDDEVPGMVPWAAKSGFRGTDHQCLSAYSW